MCFPQVFYPLCPLFMFAAPSSLPTRCRAWLWLSLSFLAVLAPASLQAAGPTAPTNLTADMTIPSSYYANAYNNKLSAGTPFFALSWTDNSSDETFFEIDIQILNNGYNIPWQPYTYAAANSTSTVLPIQIGGAQQGTKVEFRVYACYGTIAADNSVKVSAKSVIEPEAFVLYTSPTVINSADITGAAAAPTNFTVGIAANTDGTLTFSWKDNCLVEEGYEFYFSATDTGTAPASGATPAFVFGFGSHPPNVGTGGALTAGTTYYMWIRARRANAQYVNNAPVTFDYSGYAKTSLKMPTGLETPTNLTATELSENKLRLSWTNNSGVASGYNIYWQTLPESGSGYTLLGSTGSASSVDIPWYPGVATEWQVQAIQQITDPSTGNVTTTGQSVNSNSASLTLPFLDVTNLTAVFTVDPVAQAPVATLNWTPNSQVATGYEVLYRQSNTGANFAQAQVLPSITANTASITSASIGDAFVPGTSYDFQVVAYYTNNGSTVQSNGTTTTATSLEGITSLPYAPITLGVGFSYSLTTTQTSALQSSNVTGLPPGLTYSGGSIGGTPTQAGVFVCPMTATFASGITSTLNLTLRVLTPPAPPITPLTITAPIVGTAAAATLPLGEFFADPDTEAAVDMNTSLGDIIIVLQPTLTPDTYANFMAYVNNTNAAGNYAGSVFHRLSPGFVLQGGGYKPITGTDGLPDNFQEVTELPSPANEPGISNVMGTVALAKGATPNSGTHDFFISLANNSSQLDNAVGGFTAFGRVVNPIGSGALVAPAVDAITNLQGSNAYTINLTPSGSTTPSPGVNPLGSNPDASLGQGTIWPMNANPAPTTMNSSECVTINSITTLAVLKYQVTTPDSNGFVTATIDSNNNLLLQGVSGTPDGSTSSPIVISATDVDGNITTQTFTVTVNSTYNYAVITGQPQGTTVQNGSNVTFQVIATGDSLQYQWRKNNVAIPGATGSSLTLNNVSATDIAYYQVAVSNAADLVVSAAAHLTVQLPPTITTPPATQTVNYNSPVTFSVTATGDPTLTYQWYKGSTAITGATGSSYTIPHLLMTDAGSYYVIVTNNIGSASSSASAAVLTVTPIDSDGDGVTDDVELATGTLPNNWDTDGDGYGDGVEESLQTDPRVPASNPGALWFVAQHDGAAALASISMKLVKGGTEPNSLFTPAHTDTVPQQWVATQELRNDQYASILDYALRKMGIIEIVNEVVSGTPTGRRFVRYPKGTGQNLCYLAAPLPAPDSPPAAAASPPSCDIGSDNGGITFYVSRALAKNPVRSISWYGAYLATLALNDLYAYPTKCQPATWAYNLTANGYRIPTFTSWQWAAQGGTLGGPTGLLYPTGASVSATLANYGNTGTTPGPKAVGGYPASVLGLYDMAGNVAEWTWDPDPADATKSYARGGSYASLPSILKCASDQEYPRINLSPEVGVRLILTEDATPRITTQPASQFVNVGDAVTLSVVAAGAPPLSYQWMKNNVALAGQTSASLSIPAAAITSAGGYTVKITTNGAGSVTSTVAGLSVLNVPAVMASSTVLPNKPTSIPITLAAAPGQTFSYQWYQLDGASQTTLSNTGVRTGTTASKLVFSTVGDSDAGTYQCVITPTSGGSPVTGNPKMVPLSVSSALIVLEPPSALTTATVTLPAAIIGGAYTLNAYSGLFDTSTNKVPASFSIVGLPAGLSYNAKTGVITGHPSNPLITSAVIKITATNGAGSSSTVTTTLQILGMQPAAIGTFVAAIARQSSPTNNNNLGGRLDLTTTGIGAYTGKVTLGGTVYPITGNLGGSVLNPSTASPSAATTVTSSVLIPRTGKTSLLMSISVDVSSVGSYLLTGSIGELAAGATTASNVAAINGWRNVASAIAGGVQTTTSMGVDGYFTMVYDAPAGSTDPTLLPLGESYFTASVATLGTVTEAGRLADGSAVAGSSVMGSAGQVLLYQPLYAGQGSALGTVTFAKTPRIATGASGMTWLKNALPATATDRSYKTGFGPLNLVLLSGGTYTPPTAGTPVMGLTYTAGVNNAQFTFSSGGLASPLGLLCGISNQNVPVFQFSTLATPTGTITPASGVFTGTIKVVATGLSATYYGVIVPDPANAAKSVGHGSFTLPSSASATSPILSGAVLLQKYP